MLRCVEFMEQITSVEEGVAERRPWFAQMRAVRRVLPRLPEVSVAMRGGEGPTG